jgi:predicted dehydrogenase
MLFADSQIETNEMPKSLRTVVIGSGFSDRVQLHSFKAHPSIDVIAVCSRTESHIKKVADNHGIDTYYTDWRVMLDKEKPDLVSIVTPPALHKEMTIAAFEAGAHVICEKPLAMNADETRAMLDAAEKHQKVHVVNHEFRYIPARYYQRVLLDEGYIGKPLLLEGTEFSGWRRDATDKWDWWSDKDMGGGMYGALGSHYLDTFRWWTDANIATITGQLRIPYNSRPDADGNPIPVTADDGASMLMTLSNGVNAILNMSSVASGFVKRLVIHGSEGALVVENNKTLQGRTKGEKDLHPIKIPDQYVPPLWTPDENLLVGPFYKLVDLTVQKIYGHELSDPRLEPANFADGIEIQKALDAGRESHEKGERITL